jgi:SWIM zinc finger
MNLTVEQVIEMAPDAAAAAAGKKLAPAKNWPELGRSSTAMWGKCQGSSVYQVKIDVANLGYNCSCPSRKFPCKHVLGLLILAVQSPDAVAQSDAPAWVDEWLEKRRAREEKQAIPPAKPAPEPADLKARQRRIEQRGKLVGDGLERLDLWMKDLVRAGLAEVSAKPSSLWDEQAKRLVDAQATRPSHAHRAAGFAASFIARLGDTAARRAWANQVVAACV